MNELQCPYCGNEQEPDDMHEPDITHEIECNKCGKIYGVIIEYWPSYTCSKMPCANGGTHEMKKVTRCPRIIFGKEEYFCIHCDYREDREAECVKDCVQNIKDCWKCTIKE